MLKISKTYLYEEVSMKKFGKVLLITTWVIFFVFLVSVIGASTGFAADKIVEGVLEEYTASSVKVAGWHYHICKDKDLDNPEHKGIWVFDMKREEISFDDLSGALEVKIYIDQAKNCVWKIHVLKFTE
jgi:hypothetical protein